MSEFAQLIELKRKGPVAKVLLDGVELGALLALDPIQVTCDPAGMPTIRLALMADRITVDDDAAGGGQQQVMSPEAEQQAKLEYRAQVADRVLGGG